ncbi:MAG: class I SAM-dependent methyltransferase [Proteobacteria bacterium]|nr:class I SAM-dependent methyltransferase [Pseudomonadota bacterium]
MKCILCGATFPIRPIERYSIEFMGELIEVCPHICLICGFVFLHPQPDKELLERYYGNQNRVLTETAAYQDQAKWIGDVKGRVLDIGSYDGRLLKELQANGAEELYGVEPDESLNIHYERFRAMSIDDLPSEMNGTFDLITMMHVLEHVPDPVSMLGRCRELLKADGRLVIEVPDLENPYIHVEPFWMPQHLWYFTPGTLINMLRKSDLFNIWGRSRRLPYCGYRIEADRTERVRKCSSHSSDREELAVEIYQQRRQMFLERTRERLERYCGRVAIFGTGEHTQFLLKEFGDILRPEFYIDSFREGEFNYKPIYKPSSAPLVKNVIISSYDSQEEMAAIIEKAGGNPIRLYDNPVAYDTWGGE